MLVDDMIEVGPQVLRPSEPLLAMVDASLDSLKAKLESLFANMGPNKKPQAPGGPGLG